MINNRLGQIPFHVKHIQNDEWLPKGDDEKYMGERFNEQTEKYNVAQSDVVFKDLRIKYDSDCDGYYSSSWPWQIIFPNEKIECFYVDDGICLDYNGGYFKFPDIKNLTLGMFYTACQLFGVPLELTEYGEAMLNCEPDISYEQQLYDDHIGKDGIPL